MARKATPVFKPARPAKPVTPVAPPARPVRTAPVTPPVPASPVRSPGRPLSPGKSADALANAPGQVGKAFPGSKKKGK